MEFNLKAHPVNRIIYLPKELYKILGPEIKAVPNRTAVLCYSKDTAIEDVLASVEIIRADLLHAITMSKNEKNKK